VRAELGLQDDTLAVATFTETTEADANGHEVVAECARAYYASKQ